MNRPNSINLTKPNKSLSKAVNKSQLSNINNDSYRENQELKTGYSRPGQSFIRRPTPSVNKFKEESKDPRRKGF